MKIILSFQVVGFAQNDHPLPAKNKVHPAGGDVEIIFLIFHAYLENWLS